MIAAERHVQFPEDEITNRDTGLELSYAAFADRYSNLGSNTHRAEHDT
jgi:hypothetical protein